MWNYVPTLPAVDISATMTVTKKLKATGAAGLKSEKLAWTCC